MRELEPVVAGSAEDFSTHALARGAELAVVAAEMHAIGADLQRELDVVVDDQRHAVLAREPGDFLCLVEGAVLVAVLEEGDAALQGGTYLGDEPWSFGRDGVQASHLR